MASSRTSASSILRRHSSNPALTIDQWNNDDNAARRHSIDSPVAVVGSIKAKDLEIVRLKHHLTARAQLAGQLIAKLGDEIHLRQAAEKRAEEDRKKYHALRKWFNATFVPDKPHKEPGLAEALEEAFWPIVTRCKERLDSHGPDALTTRRVLVEEGISPGTATRGQMLEKLRILCSAVQVLRYNQEVQEEMIEDLRAAEQRLAQRVVDAEEEAERKEAGEGKEYPHEFIKLLESQVRRLKQEAAEVEEDYVNLSELYERMEMREVQLREKIDALETERQDILAGHQETEAQVKKLMRELRKKDERITALELGPHRVISGVRRCLRLIAEGRTAPVIEGGGRGSDFGGTS